MKLRIAKGRIAVVVVLLPVFYVLNAGPVIFFIDHVLFPLKVADRRLYFFLYDPLEKLFTDTPLEEPFNKYVNWWSMESPEG